MQTIAAAAALYLAMGTPGVAATVIYDNGGPNRSGGTEMSNTILAQDFMLAAPQALTSAVFHAVGLDNAISTAALRYSIFADNGGTPGAVVASGSAVNKLVKATGEQALGGEEYKVSFAFESAVVAAADTVYWLGLRFGDSDVPLNIYWSTTAFNDTALGMELFSGGWSGNTQEHSFSLGVGTSAVPEPAAWALMISGFALSGVALRRRRAASPALRAG